MIKKLKYIIIFLLILQLGVYLFIKQKYIELQRKNSKIEKEIESLINENNLLKIKLTTIQNQNRIRKLVNDHSNEFKPLKPKQIIEKENI